MKATVEPLEGNKVKLSVEVEEAEFDKAVDAAFRKIAREVRIPGFRPGKAPRRILENHLGTDVGRQEALRDSLPEFYVQALEQAAVDAIAPPEIDITSGEDTGGVVFDAVVEVRPRISIPGYDGLQIQVPGLDVDDEEVAAQVDRLRSQESELVTVDRPAEVGDHVTIDVAGFEEGSDEPAAGLTADDYLYEVGSGTIVDELDAEIRNAKVGDVVEFDAEIPGREQPVHFRVSLKEVKEKVLPELTDEWVSEASEFDTVVALQGDIRSRIGQVKRYQTTVAAREKAVEALVELVADDPPEVLVDDEVKRRINDVAHRLSHQGVELGQYLAATGQDADTFMAEARSGAVEAVKADLALRALAEAESLDVDEADVDREIALVAEQAGEKPAKVRRRLEQGGHLPTVRSDLKKAKALEWLLEHVELVDEAGKAVQKTELMLGSSDDQASDGDIADAEHDHEGAH